MKNKIGIAVLLIFVAVLAYFISENTEQFEPLSKISLLDMVAILSASAVYVVLQAIIFQRVLNCYGTRLSVDESFGTFILTLAGNYLFPYAGLGFRATYLKFVHSFEFKNFTAGVVLIYFTELFVFGIGGILGYALTVGIGGAADLVMLAVCIGVLALVVLYVLPVAYPSKWPLSGKISPLLNAWKEIKQNRLMVLKILGLQVLLFLVFSLMFFLSIAVINIELSGLTTFVFSMFNDFSYFVRLSPAGVGVFEASIAYPASLYGVTLQQAIMIALLMRGSVLFWIVFLSPFYGYKLGNRLAISRAKGS